MQATVNIAAKKKVKTFKLDGGIFMDADRSNNLWEHVAKQQRVNVDERCNSICLYQMPVLLRILVINTQQLNFQVEKSK